MNELTKYNKLNDKIIESEEIIKLIEARYSVLKKKFELEKFSTKEEVDKAIKAFIYYQLEPDSDEKGNNELSKV